MDSFCQSFCQIVTRCFLMSTQDSSSHYILHLTRPLFLLRLTKRCVYLGSVYVSDVSASQQNIANKVGSTYILQLSACIAETMNKLATAEARPVCVRNTSTGVVSIVCVSESGVGSWGSTKTLITIDMTGFIYDPDNVWAGLISNALFLNFQRNRYTMCLKGPKKRLTFVRTWVILKFFTALCRLAEKVFGFNM